MGTRVEVQERSFQLTSDGVRVSCASRDIYRPLLFRCGKRSEVWEHVWTYKSDRSNSHPTASE